MRQALSLITHLDVYKRQLYTYQDDYQPGMVTGQGTNLNGGYWYLMKPDGMPLVPAGDPSP